MFRMYQLDQLYIELHQIKLIPFIGSLTMLLICGCTNKRNHTPILQAKTYTQETKILPLDSVYDTSQSLTKVNFAHNEDDPLLVNPPRMFVLMK